MRFPPRSDPQREHPFNSEFSMQEGTSPYGTEVSNLRTNLHRVERRFSTSAQHCKVTQQYRRRLKTSVPRAGYPEVCDNYALIRTIGRA